MPYRQRLCSAAGCSNTTTTGGRCTVHAKQQGGGFSRFSRNASAYQGGWRELRAEILARDPICTICHVAPSTQVDHIIPARLGGPKNRGNCRGVCRHCNLALAARQSIAVKRAKRRGG